MSIQILNRFTSVVILNLEIDTLRGANLQEANLQEANLRGANLQEANLQEANLRGANLRGADLLGANLWGADLQEANLQEADLRGANLRGADLQGANLRGADLRGAKNAPLLITSLDWVVQINGLGRMKVGCQDHSIEAWRNFSELEIAQMADGATNFWSKHKTMLLMLCDAYKHPSE